MAKKISKLKHTKLKTARIKKGKQKGKIVHRWQGRKPKSKTKNRSKSKRATGISDVFKSRFNKFNTTYKRRGVKMRRVFFSFHYDNDCRRAAQVRNSNVIQNNLIESPGFIDAASWEKVRKQGDEAIKRWIRSQMEGTSVTVVLIGSQTVDYNGKVRQWVKFEIDDSLKKNNGLLGVYIHNCNDPLNGRDSKGKNPFDNLCFGGTDTLLSTKYATYDWINDDGREKLGAWIEKAAQDAGR